MVMTFVGSILLAFLAFGYVASAAPKLPFGSKLEEYPKDTPPLNGESSFQQLMDNMEEHPLEGHLHELNSGAIISIFKWVSSPLDTIMLLI